MVRGAKRSDAMVEALRLVAGGMCAADAARRTGLTRGAISRTKEYRALPRTEEFRGGKRSIEGRRKLTEGDKKND